MDPRIVFAKLLCLVMVYLRLRIVQALLTFDTACMSFGRVVAQM